MVRLHECQVAASRTSAPWAYVISYRVGGAAASTTDTMAENMHDVGSETVASCTSSGRPWHGP